MSLRRHLEARQTILRQAAEAGTRPRPRAISGWVLPQDRYAAIGRKLGGRLVRACMPAVATRSRAAGHRATFLDHLGTRQQNHREDAHTALLLRAPELYDARLLTDSGTSPIAPPT